MGDGAGLAHGSHWIGKVREGIPHRMKPESEDLLALAANAAKVARGLRARAQTSKDAHVGQTHRP
jgi:hypothetical protein